MVRKENWPLLLGEYLNECRKKPFVWGEHDCILFAAKAIEVITGENLYNSYLGYTDEKGAQEVLQAHGGLSAIVRSHLGEGEKNFKMAHRGDLALMKLGRETIGIVDDTGERIACVGPNGLVRMPLRTAWRIWGY